MLRNLAHKLSESLINLSHTYYKHWLTRNRYGSRMESYIDGKNPKNVHDIEFFALEYQTKLTKGKL